MNFTPASSSLSAAITTTETKKTEATISITQEKNSKNIQSPSFLINRTSSFLPTLRLTPSSSNNNNSPSSSTIATTTNSASNNSSLSRNLLTQEEEVSLLKQRSLSLNSPMRFLIHLNRKEKWFLSSLFSSSLSWISFLLLITQTIGYSRYSHHILNHLLFSSRFTSSSSSLLKAKTFENNNNNTRPIPTTSATITPSIQELSRIQTLLEEKEESTFLLPLGLHNLRNTCYMNSILQALYHLKGYSLPFLQEFKPTPAFADSPFTDFLKTSSSSSSSTGGKESVSGKRTKAFIHAWNFKKSSFGSELGLLFQEMFSKSVEMYHKSKSSKTSSTLFRPAIVPLDIAKFLKININEQEDAEELLLKILNEVDESLMTSIPPSSSNNYNKGKKKASIPLLPSDLFTCQLQQLIYPIQSEDNYLSSNKTLKYFDLSIAIPPTKLIQQNSPVQQQPKRKITLQECIQNYFQPEFLIGSNQYKCSKYGLTDAKKILKISKFPKVLIIHLKRFSFDPETYQFKKVTTPVEISKSLDLSSYAVESNEIQKIHEMKDKDDHDTSIISTSCINNSTNNLGKYRLQSVVIHKGSIDHGHYYTLAKIYPQPDILDEENSKAYWVKLDDNRVSRMDEESVLIEATGEERIPQPNSKSLYEKFVGADPISSNAYLLFYTLQE